jgi:hypothetical protein
MYTVVDFKTKKALKEAVKFGQEVRIYAPGLGTPPVNGRATLEGPHYPKPHTWYATATMKDGLVIDVK